MSANQIIFIDSNILIYSLYGTDEQKQLIGKILSHHDNTPLLSIQVLKEFANVSIRKKLHKTSTELKKHLSKIKISFNVAEITTDTILQALDIRDRYKYSFYDSLIIATALENKCMILYSEDLQHNQGIGKKMKILNPFK